MPVASLSRAGPGSRHAIVQYPYSPAVSECIRAIPGREFSKPYKVWTIPLTPTNILALRESLQGIGWHLQIPRDIANELNETFAQEKEAREIRTAGDAVVDFDFKTEPYAHQRAGLAFLQKLDGGALLWEMGLGKTKTAIDFVEWLGKHGEGDRQHPADGYRYDGCPGCGLRVLVICPNTVKRNWTAEIKKHAGHENFVLPTGTLAKRATQLASERYTIINAEALSHKVMAEALRAIEWDLVIVDESTRFKTPEAARTKALMKLRTKRRVILTGTPITGKPADAYVQFEFVAPGTFGKSFFAFKQRYLAIDWFGNVTGVKPEKADELRTRIDARSYRILKEDVLDLPPKVYVDRWVEMAGEQKRAYDQMRDELRVELMNRPDLTVANILTLVLRLTQITGGAVGERGAYDWLKPSAKADELDDMLTGDLGGEQVVVFGLYQFELEQLSKRFGGGIIYGPTPEGERARLIEAFQRGDSRILFAQTRTGGIGINLTAAKTAVYYTRGWSLEEYLQSQDRLHRIGQTGTVSIVHLLATGSVDGDIAAALADKKNLADHLTGDAARGLAAQLLGT